MDNILYPNHRYTRQGQGRNRKSVKKFAGVLEESRGKKIINGILATGIVLMICYLCVFFSYHAVLKPLININNIEIHFQEKLDIDQQDILLASGLNRSLRYADVDEEAVAESIMKAFPYIKEVRVSKIFPATVSIFIWGRKPVCVSLFDTGNLSVPFAVDTEGRVFELGTAVKEFDLPILSGITVSALELNAQIPVSYVPVLEDLMILKEKNTNIYGRISEILVDEKNGKGYDLYVYFRTYDVPIQMGSRLELSEIEAAVQILDLLQSTGLSGFYEKLDFRSGKPILKKK